MNDLPVHFFTIVLDGMPFITHHLNEFRKLPFRWHWHVVQGAAFPTHDTAWCAHNGGRVPEKYLPHGQSLDGTMQYIYGLNPKEVSVYRACCRRPVVWDGKIEMVRAPMKNIKEPCLLWEIDADELWTADQFIRGRQMFLDDPTKTAAVYRCHYFVGSDLIITSLETYGNHDGEWLRTWRYQPGDKWERHEPPTLMRDGSDVGKITPFNYAETVGNGLVFQHFAYATEKQLEFKEEYYGYKNAMKHWKRLQEYQNFPIDLRSFFPWVKDGAIVDRASKVGVTPLIAL